MTVRMRRRSVLSLGLAALGGVCLPLRRALAMSHPSGADLLDRPEGARVIQDPDLMPTQLHEPPMLAAAVAAGELPPVAERIGRHPLVMQPLNEIGRHGGTLRRAFIGPGDYLVAIRFASGPDGFLFWDYEWKTLVPNIARAWDISADGRVFVLHLREGMRWSDGAPFTADDVMFWYRDMYLDHRVIGRASAYLRVDGKDVVIEKIDDFTIQFISPKPYPMLDQVLAGYTDVGGQSIYGRLGMGGYAPMHYLSRFHPNYHSEAEAARLAKAAGFANWAIHLKSLNDWTLNTELPVLTPWKAVSAINRPKFVLERNPYSIWVDVAGNQLPYIDRIQHTYASGSDAVNFLASAGELDSQDRHLQISKLPYLMSNRRRSKYEVHLDPMEGTDLGIRLNLNYHEDPEVGVLLGTPNFRRALSMAIDRDAINESYLLGTGHPSASVPIQGSRYYPGTEWAERWARLDRGAADRLLDGLGLSARDSEGYRLRKDGSDRVRLSCSASTSQFDYPSVAEMVRENWREVGLDLDVQVMDQTLQFQRSISGSIQMTFQFVGIEDPFTYPEHVFPFMTDGSSALIGKDYAKWFVSNGKDGLKPPPEIVLMMEMWRKAREVDEDERIRLGRELIRMHVDQVLSIGLVSGGLSIYAIRIAGDRLGNVPRRVKNSTAVRSPVNSLPMTFFYRKT